MFPGPIFFCWEQPVPTVVDYSPSCSCLFPGPIFFCWEQPVPAVVDYSPSCSCLVGYSPSHCPVLRIVRSIWFWIPDLEGSSPSCSCLLARRESSCQVVGWGCSHPLRISCSLSYLEEPFYVPQAQLGEQDKGVFCVMC